MSSSQELARNTYAAGIAGAIQITIMNPLDCLRIRWQVAKTEQTMVGFVGSVVKQEGWWTGLHRPGLGLNLFCVTFVQGLRVGLYPTVRDAIAPPGNVRPDAMALAGLINGALAYGVSAPVWLMKVRYQADAQLRRGVLWPAALTGWWLGSSALITRGALLSAGHLTGYDSTKQLATKRGWLADSPLLHVMAATVGALCASTLSAPADILQTKLQTGAGAGGLVSCAASVLREHGVLGFFRGWTANVARLVPTFIIGSTIYEQARVLAGLEYMK